MEEYIAPNRKRIPYGMMNFAVIRRDDCYYVDKTRFIPIIEDADKFFQNMGYPHPLCAREGRPKMSL